MNAKWRTPAKKCAMINNRIREKKVNIINVTIDYHIRVTSLPTFFFVCGNNLATTTINNEQKELLHTQIKYHCHLLVIRRTMHIIIHKTAREHAKYNNNKDK